MLPKRVAGLRGEHWWRVGDNAPYFGVGGGNCFGQAGMPARYWMAVRGRADESGEDDQFREQKKSLEGRGVGPRCRSAPARLRDQGEGAEKNAGNVASASLLILIVPPTEIAG